LLGSFVFRLLKPLLTILIGRLCESIEIDRKGLVAPLRLMLLGILFVINASYSSTLLGRNFWRNSGIVLIVLGVTWLSMRLVSTRAAAIKAHGLELLRAAALWADFAAVT
jgi:hypothetical protein